MLKISHTRQEWVNLAVKGLTSQGWKQSLTTDKWPSCVYRGDNGCRCAIGWGIPDEAYRPEMEGSAAYTYATIPAHDGTLKEGVNFLWELQGVHDNNEDPQAMEIAMHAFVQKHSLTWPA
jgi:hypothetical protein